MRARFSVVAAVLVSCSPAAAHPDEACPEGWFCEPERPDPRRHPAALPTPAEPRSRAAPASPAPPAATASLTATAPPAAFPEPAVRRNVGVLVRGRCTIPEVYGGGARPLMAGVGLGFRALPLEQLAVDVAVDALGGSDALDARRRELAASAALTVFLDTRQPVQVFLSSGLFYSWAHVAPRSQPDRNFRYLGAFMGLGAQYALSRAYSLSFDITLFVRGRVDGASAPEFVNQTTGETSNASGGSLAGVGIIRSF